MAVKRKLPIKDTNADKAETHQSTTFPASLPTKDSPAQSSKKARSKSPPPKTDAASDDEVAPLSDIPDNRGQLEYTSQVLDLAAAAWQESGFEESDDDDDDDVHGMLSTHPSNLILELVKPSEKNPLKFTLCDGFI